MTNYIIHSNLSQLGKQTKKIKEIPDDIVKSCDTCQRFTSPPVRCKVPFPTEEILVFGDESSTDLMWLDFKAVLHVVDNAARFYSAIFLDSNGASIGQTVEEIWFVFLYKCVALYTGYTNRLRTGQGHVFISNR